MCYKGERGRDRKRKARHEDRETETWADRPEGKGRERWTKERQEDTVTDHVYAPIQAHGCSQSCAPCHTYGHGHTQSRTHTHAHTQPPTPSPTHPVPRTKVRPGEEPGPSHSPDPRWLPEAPQKSPVPADPVGPLNLTAGGLPFTCSKSRNHL